LADKQLSPSIHAKADEKEVNFKEIATKYLTRPLVMLFQEPILIAITIYMSLIYGTRLSRPSFLAFVTDSFLGIIYMFFEVFPLIYQEKRGWNAGVGGLPFFSMLFGIVIGCIIMTYHVKTRFARKLAQTGSVIPEERLIPTMIGGFLLPIGLFWFAWTNNVSSPWPQIIALVPIGIGFNLIFVQGLTYTVDCYLMYANSAIAGNTFVRSWVGAGFPLFATAMFRNLGIEWATSLLGFLSLAMLPFPILFYIYGAKIRKMSKFSPF
jgi:MFS transporter, DHA1 family, multidrug resistance protein